MNFNVSIFSKEGMIKLSYFINQKINTRSKLQFVKDTHRHNKISMSLLYYLKKIHLKDHSY